MPVRVSCTRKRRSRTVQAGFTLVELLVVLAIIGLLASLTAPRVIRYLGGARTQTAEVRLKTLSTALDLYRLEVGRYPTKQEGLQALVSRPAAAGNWNGPYINRMEELKDPWDRMYEYNFPGKHGVYDLASLGADGVEGGEGENRDVVSW